MRSFVNSFTEDLEKGNQKKAYNENRVGRPTSFFWQYLPLERRKNRSGKKSHDFLKVVERNACSRFRNGNQGDGGTHLLPKARPGIG